MPLGWATLAVSAIGAASQADSSRHAANTQADSQNAALGLQRDQYNQTRADNAPWRNIGGSAIDRLNKLYGFQGQQETRDQIRARLSSQYPTQLAQDNSLSSRLSPMDGYAGMGLYGMGDASSADGQGFFRGVASNVMTPQANPALDAAVEAEFAKQGQSQGGSPDMMAMLGIDPGYQFRLAQGNKALGNAQASRGGYFSGGAMKAATDYNQNSASQEFGNAFNRLTTMAGMGSAANNSNTQAGMNYANQGGNYLSNIGDARASGYIGQSNALTGGLQDIYRVGSRNNWWQNPSSSGYTPSRTDSIPSDGSWL